MVSFHSQDSARVCFSELGYRIPYFNRLVHILFRENDSRFVMSGDFIADIDHVVFAWFSRITFAHSGIVGGLRREGAVALPVYGCLPNRLDGGGQEAVIAPHPLSGLRSVYQALRISGQMIIQLSEITLALSRRVIMRLSGRSSGK